MGWGQDFMLVSQVFSLIHHFIELAFCTQKVWNKELSPNFGNHGLELEKCRMPSSGLVQSPKPAGWVWVSLGLVDKLGKNGAGDR